MTVYEKKVYLDLETLTILRGLKMCLGENESEIVRRAIRLYYTYLNLFREMGKGGRKKNGKQVLN